MVLLFLCHFILNFVWFIGIVKHVKRSISKPASAGEHIEQIDEPIGEEVKDLPVGVPLQRNNSTHSKDDKIQ